MKTKVIKYKKPKPRIKVAPPGKRHRSKKDYNRREKHPQAKLFGRGED